MVIDFEGKGDTKLGFAVERHSKDEESWGLWTQFGLSWLGHCRIYNNPFH